MPHARSHRAEPAGLRRLGGGLLAAVLLALPALPAAALDYQFHGFAAQGFSLSGGNNYFGDSVHGSTDFYELGINGSLSLTPGLLVSAQGLLRRAGAADDEGARLDYALLDYRFIGSQSANAGLRLGRVKNPFGFYNETRDVVFTRPGILLPDAIYFESAGLRTLLFSRDGAQLYGGSVCGDHYFSFDANYSLDSRLNDKQKRELTGGMALPVEVQVVNGHAGRLQDEWDGGRLKFALSYLHAEFSLRPSAQLPLKGNDAFDIYVASARYNARRFALTGEYSLIFNRDQTGLAPAPSTASDGFYLQGEYRFAPRWTGMARYTASFANRHDRDGRAYAAQTGGDRYSQFSHDQTLGLNWQPSEHWGLWAEFHLVQGTDNVPGGDNAGRRSADHWNLFQLMAAYRF